MNFGGTTNSVVSNPGIIRTDPRNQWVELEVLVINFNGPECTRGSKEYKVVLQSQAGSNMTRMITAYRSNIFYMVGIASMELPEGKFNYSVDTHEVMSFGNSLFRYSLFGMNLTCVVDDPATAALKKLKASASPSTTIQAGSSANSQH